MKFETGKYQTEDSFDETRYFGFSSSCLWITVQVACGFYNIDVVTKNYGFSFTDGILFLQRKMHETFWSKRIFSN